MKTPPTERFWPKVDKNGPTPEHCPELGNCWVWTGAKTAPGKYGVFGGPRSEPLTLAHRFSYQLHFGGLRPGFRICHHCDNPPCVRPSHLFQGTDTDNAQDCINKGRRGRGSSKLTRTEAVEIRRLRNEEKISLKKIAPRFGITFSNVSVIALRKSWAA